MVALEKAGRPTRAGRQRCVRDHSPLPFAQSQEKLFSSGQLLCFGLIPDKPSPLQCWRSELVPQLTACCVTVRAPVALSFDDSSTGNATRGGQEDVRPS